MLARHHRVGLHAVAALTIAGVAVVATGGIGNAAAGARPDSYGGDATAATFEVQLDRNPPIFPAVNDPLHMWVPYAESSIDSSGGASAIASSIYPGQGLIGAPKLLCNFAAQFCNSLPGGAPPDYPDWAQAQYPTQKDASAQTSQQPFAAGPFSVTPHQLVAHADPDRVEGTAVVEGMGLDPVVSAQSATAHSKQQFEGSTLVLTTESVLKGLSIGGGALLIQQLDSVATAKVDGGKISSASAVTTVTGATAGGTPVSIDSTGIHAGGSGDNGAVNKQLNAALAQLDKSGISLRSLGNTRVVKRGAAQAATGGLLMTFKMSVNSPVELPLPVSAEGDYAGVLMIGGAGVSAYASPAVAFHPLSIPTVPSSVAGHVPGGAATAAGGALPGSGSTTSGTAAAGTPPDLGPVPGRHGLRLVGVDLTNKRLQTLMLVLLGYPLLVLLGRPLRAPARLPGRR
jgi:hypothetical protein